MFCHAPHAQDVYVVIVSGMKLPARRPYKRLWATRPPLPSGEGRASGRSIGSSTILLPRLRGRPGGGLLPRRRKRQEQARQSPVAPRGPPSTPPASGRGGKGAALPLGSRKENGRLSLPGGRLRFRSVGCRWPDSPPPLAGEAGWGPAAAPAEVAGTSAAKSRRAKRPSPGPSRKREGRKRAVLLPGGRRGDGGPLLPSGRLRFQSVACRRPAPPRPLAGEAGWGLLPRWRKWRAQARQSPVAPVGPPPTPPASGRGERGGPPTRQQEREWVALLARRKVALPVGRLPVA